MTVLANTDSYKMSHKGFMNEGTTFIYSNLTARSSKYFTAKNNDYKNDVVVFGLQAFIKDYLIEEWNREFFNKPKGQVISRFKRLTDSYLGTDSVSMEHFEKLHDLGYLPISIKSLPEGSRVPIKVPMLTICNTHEDFAWLTNYLETVLSCELWKPMTTATIIAEYRKAVNKYAVETTGSIAGTEFQLHGFEFRGMSGRKDAAINGAAFLLSSCGTDCVPALEVIEDYYGSDITQEFIATSVPASEHSIACLGSSVEGELESYRKWITQDYPTGIVSLVSDTYDYFKVLTEYLPVLREDIMARPVNELGLSKVVIRPDSGDPVDIICGTAEIIDLGSESREEAIAILQEIIYVRVTDETDHGECGPVEYEVIFTNNGVTYRASFDLFWNRYDKQYYYLEEVTLLSLEETTLTPEERGSIDILWDIFGGTVTEQGYKVLDSHIGLIYGDSITYQRATQIMERLKAKGFASTNAVFGIGSYTMNMLTRDTLGMAVKATYAEVDGEGYDLFKDPATDDGTKKSAKGLLRVEKNGDSMTLLDQQSVEQEEGGLLQEVFRDGELKIEHTFTEIRERLWS